jgi:hypothetical protein
MRCSAIVLLVLLPGSAAAADAVLADMAGEWIGRGQAREAADAPPEPVYCRIEGRVDAAGAVLTQSGRCAAGNRSQPFDARIKKAGAGYRMEISGRKGQDPVQLIGRSEGERLAFDTAGSGAGSGPEQPISAIDVEVSPNGYRMTIARNAEGSGPPFTSASIDFTKR